jgi:hypothetical protein
MKRAKISALLFLSLFAVTFASRPPALPAQGPEAQAANHNVSAARTIVRPAAIDANGRRLAELLDSMHVEQLWQANTRIDWETGEPSQRSEDEPPAHDTHCSAFAAAVGYRMGVYMLRPPEHPQKLLANAQAEWFRSAEGKRNGWSPMRDNSESVPAVAAQSLANTGNLVVIVYASPDAKRPGHIVVVHPSDKSLNQLLNEGPDVTQAGTHNYTNVSARKGFKDHPGAWPSGVRYYVHSADWRGR